LTVDLRLAIPAVVAWIASGLVIAVPDGAWWIALVLGIAGIGCALAARRAGVFAILALCCIAAALVSAVAAARVVERQPESVVAAARTNHSVTAQLVLTSAVVTGSTRYSATIVAVEIGGRATSISAPALVFGEAPSGARIGTQLLLSGTLKASAPEDSTAFLMFARGEAVVIGDPPWYLGWANELRDEFRDAAGDLAGDGGDLLPGLAIGDTSAVSAELSAAMKASSLSHLTAVSGANCAVVVGLIVLVGGVLGASRVVRTIAAALVLTGFVVLVTPEPSVLRAAVMAAIVLAALLSGRPVRGIPVLSLAVVVLLVADPWLSREYGFVLSVLATGGLLVLARPLAGLMARWLPMPVAAIIAVPLAAQVACQPVLILLNPSLPTYGIIANVLAEPAAPVATVLGLLSCVSLPGLPWLGSLFASVAWVPSTWIAAVATFFAGLPAAAIPWPGGAAGVALLATLTFLALLAMFGRGRVRMLAAAVAVCTVVTLVAASATTHIVEQLSRPSDWQIAMCDIGQGDATLVRSEGQIALIDTGPKPERLAHCLNELGVSHVDLLVLTHYDLDHVGGAETVVGKVDTVLIGPSGGPDDDALDAAFVAGGATVIDAHRGMSGLLGELRWDILWPQSQLHGLEPGNDVSIAMTFSPVGECLQGCLSSLFLADLGERPQGLLLAAGPVAEVDVVKVSHHGSADQNAQTYEKASAIVGIIGVGADNTYGHPTDRLLSMLAAVGTEPLRTDRNGMILLSAGGTAESGTTESANARTVAVWTEKSVGAAK
jgi:competence protein ComEC